MMTHPKISIVQKVKYDVLSLPIAWLIFSTWVLISEAFPRFPSTEGQEANPQPSVLGILSLIYFAAGALWILIKILRGVRNRQVISSEQKSGFAFFLGTTVMGIENYFPHNACTRLGVRTAFFGIFRAWAESRFESESTLPPTSG